MLYWVKERESIRKRKESGEPPPWTKNHILAEYRFCNVRRRDDRVSRWLINNLYNRSYVKSPDFVALVALCRFVNWPPTLAALLDAGLICSPLPWSKIGKFLDKRCAKDEKTWTAAYMIKGHPDGKGPHIARSLEQGFRKSGAAIDATIATQRCELVHAALLDVPECGRFLAGQIVADLTYTPLLEKATDLCTWAPLGPGSRRGYNRLMGIDPIKKWPEERAFLNKLIAVRAMIIEELGEEYRDLELMSVQSVFCEFDKYSRVLNGEGRPRAKYVSHSGFYEQ